MSGGKTTRTPETEHPERDIVRMLSNQRKRVRAELDRDMKPEVSIARATRFDDGFIAQRTRSVDSAVLRAEASFQSHKANALRLLTAEVERGRIDAARAEKAFSQINSMTLGYAVPEARRQQYAGERDFNAMMARDRQ